MTDYWDNTGGNANLAKLPLHVREGMTQHIPHRQDECNASFMIFRQTPGLNHPNARCNVVAFKKEPNSSISINSGIQLDFTDFTGRLALATAIVDQQFFGRMLTGMIRAFISAGGDLDAVLQASNVVRLKAENVAYFEEPADD